MDSNGKTQGVAEGSDVSRHIEVAPISEARPGYAIARDGGGDRGGSPLRARPARPRKLGALPPACVHSGERGKRGPCLLEVAAADGVARPVPDPVEPPEQDQQEQIQLVINNQTFSGIDMEFVVGSGDAQILPYGFAGVVLPDPSQGENFLA